MTYRFYPGSNDVELFKEDLDANIRYVQTNLKYIEDPKDEEFVTNLLQFWEKFDRLSEKQLWHMTRFWQEINHNRPENSGTSIQKEQELTPPRVQINGAGMIKLFDTAAKHLKHPSIKYRLLENNFDLRDHITFYRTTEKSKSGAGNVACIGYASSQRQEMLCLIRRDGTVTFGMFCFNKPELQQFLKQLIEDHLNQLSMNGKKYSNCCFCGLELTNEGSIHHGYGPVCAEKWGLPWEDRKPVKLMDLD